MNCESFEGGRADQILECLHMAVTFHPCTSVGGYRCPGFVEGVPESGDVEGPARVPDLKRGPAGLRSKDHECKSFSLPPCSDQSLGDKSKQT